MKATSHPIRVKRWRTMQPDRKGLLRWVSWYMVVTPTGFGVGYPQPTAALARSGLTTQERCKALGLP